MPKRGVCARWLYYNLDRFDLTRLNEATGVPSISREWLEKTPLRDASLAEQQCVADVLEMVDTAMEQTKTMIAKMQQVKAGMMYDLFTRGILLNGELRPPRKGAPQLYKESPFGWIPKEWGIARVDSCGSVKLGRQRSPDQHSGVWSTPYLRVANVFDGYIDFSDILEMDFTPKERKAFSVVSGDILLNEGQSLELVGRCSLYEGNDNQFCFQNTLVRFRASSGHFPSFYRWLFKLCLDSGRFKTIAKQTTSVAHLGADRFARMLAPLLNLDEQRLIADRLNVEQRLVDIESARMKKLHDLKSGLMHDLLTGRVRIPVSMLKRATVST
jgi:type I restriction enzyme S subunit